MESNFFNHMDKRRFDRKLLFHYLKIMDHASGDLAGYLGDISSQGLMLFSRSKFKNGRPAVFRVDLKKETGQDEILVFKAKCVWCHPDANPEYQVAGFRFVDIDRSTADIIDYLIQKYGCGL